MITNKITNLTKILTENLIGILTKNISITVKIMTRMKIDIFVIILYTFISVNPNIN